MKMEGLISSDVVTDDLVRVLRGHTGGVGNYLSPEQKQQIFEGRKNTAENKSPYNSEKLDQAADDFFASHPLSMLEKG